MNLGPVGDRAQTQKLFSATNQQVTFVSHTVLVIRKKKKKKKKRKVKSTPPRVLRFFCTAGFWKRITVTETVGTHRYIS